MAISGVNLGSELMQWVEDEKLEQHSIKNHNHMAQWVEQLTCIQEVAGSNPAGEQIFFLKLNTFCIHVFKTQFDNTVTWHSKHAMKCDFSEIKRHLGTQIC